jgi:hypothetical protein
MVRIVGSNVHARIGLNAITWLGNAHALLDILESVVKMVGLSRDKRFSALLAQLDFGNVQSFLYHWTRVVSCKNSKRVLNSLINWQAQFKGGLQSLARYTAFNLLICLQIHFLLLCISLNKQFLLFKRFTIDLNCPKASKFAIPNWEGLPNWRVVHTCLRLWDIRTRDCNLCFKIFVSVLLAWRANWNFACVECSNGTFGFGCKPCQCVEETTLKCDRVTGSCACKAGFTSVFCDQSKCV